MLTEPIEHVLVLLLVIILPIIALINILSERFEGNKKLVWVIVVVIIPILGSILYFLIGKRKRLN
jgi:heme/copper-type cytochrome/quinol oxidase subunit 4